MDTARTGAATAGSRVLGERTERKTESRRPKTKTGPRAVVPPLRFCPSAVQRCH